jgi:hypothetical protein
MEMRIMHAHNACIIQFYIYAYLLSHTMMITQTSKQVTIYSFSSPSNKKSLNQIKMVRKLFLMRHAITESNINKIWTGHLDINIATSIPHPPILHPTGEVHLDAIICSTAKRWTELHWTWLINYKWIHTWLLVRIFSNNVSNSFVILNGFYIL